MSCLVTLIIRLVTFKSCLWIFIFCLVLPRSSAMILNFEIFLNGTWILLIKKKIKVCYAKLFMKKSFNVYFFVLFMNYLWDFRRSLCLSIFILILKVYVCLFNEYSTTCTFFYHISALLSYHYTFYYIYAIHSFIFLYLSVYAINIITKLSHESWM